MEDIQHPTSVDGLLSSAPPTILQQNKYMFI